MWFSKLKVLLLSCAFYLNFNFAQVRKANVNSMSPTPSALLLELSSQHSIGRSGKSWDEIAAESNYGLGSYKKPKPEPYYYKWEAPFGYGYKTGKMKASQSQDRNGVVTGSYSIMGPDELMREVVYRADESGYSATIRTNEPGSANVKINPANVVIISTATTSRPGGGSGGGMGNGGDYGSVSKPYYPTKAMTTTSLPWPPKPPTQIENNLEDNIKEIIEEYDYADIDVQDEYEDEFETSTEALFDDLVDERGPSLMFVSKRKNKSKGFNFTPKFKTLFDIKHKVS